MVAFKLTPPVSTKFFNFNKFVKDIDLDSFLANPDSLPCKYNNSSFVDRQILRIIRNYELLEITNYLRIIRNNNLRKYFIKGPKYREVEKFGK